MGPQCARHRPAALQGLRQPRGLIQARHCRGVPGAPWATMPSLLCWASVRRRAAALPRLGIGIRFYSEPRRAQKSQLQPCDISQKRHRWGPPNAPSTPLSGPAVHHCDYWRHACIPTYAYCPGGVSVPDGCAAPTPADAAPGHQRRCERGPRRHQLVTMQSPAAVAGMRGAECPCKAKEGLSQQKSGVQLALLACIGQVRLPACNTCVCRSVQVPECAHAVVLAV